MHIEYMIAYYSYLFIIIPTKHAMTYISELQTSQQLPMRFT